MPKHLGFRFAPQILIGLGTQGGSCVSGLGCPPDVGVRETQKSEPLECFPRNLRVEWERVGVGRRCDVGPLLVRARAIRPIFRRHRDGVPRLRHLAVAGLLVAAEGGRALLAPP